MSTPKKEQLPRIDDVLKNELEGGLKLKPTKTEEKIVLPSQTEIAQEKGQQQLLKSIETFSPEKLSHANTAVKNPLPTAAEIEAEKASS